MVIAKKDLKNLTIKELDEIILNSSQFLKLKSNKENSEQDLDTVYSYFKDYLPSSCNMRPLIFLEKNNKRTYDLFYEVFKEMESFSDKVFDIAKVDFKKVDRFRFYNLCAELICKHSLNICRLKELEMSLSIILNISKSKLPAIFDKNYPGYLQNKNALNLLLKQPFYNENEILF